MAQTQQNTSSHKKMDIILFVTTGDHYIQTNIEGKYQSATQMQQLKILVSETLGVG